MSNYNPYICQIWHLKFGQRLNTLDCPGGSQDAFFVFLRMQVRSARMKVQNDTRLSFSQVIVNFTVITNQILLVDVQNAKWGSWATLFVKIIDNLVLFRLVNSFAWHLVPVHSARWRICLKDTMKLRIVANSGVDVVFVLQDFWFVWNFFLGVFDSEIRNA